MSWNTPALAGQITRLLEEVLFSPSIEPGAVCEVGDRIGRFLLVREIGRGGFGLVFEAEDTDLRRRVAIKVLRPERGHTPTTLEWIRREGEAAARVRHPSVVTLHDVGQWAGGTYLVYELLRGETLADRLARGPIRPDEARRILRTVAEGLSRMHGAGVVHRDLKPANVFLDEDGTVKILDLGLAQIAGAVGIQAGSPPYAAPEQWKDGASDARADVYAWGILATRLLDGKSTGPPTFGSL
jgi:serine/threonine protein kinase